MTNADCGTRILYRVRSVQARWRHGFTLAVVLTLGACAAVQSEEAVPIEPSPPPTATAETDPGAPRDMIDAALDDAARRASVPRADITVVSAEAVTWSDGSLGCPQKGMLYTMALVPGYRIVVQAGGQRLEYHASTRSKPAYCPAERAVEPAPGVSPI